MSILNIFRKQPKKANTSNNQLFADASSVAESEKQYYQPDEYYTYLTGQGGPFEERVLTYAEHRRASNPSANGLYVPEILMLSFCQNFPNPKNGYPGYWWFKYGIRNVGQVLEHLAERQFIIMNDETGKYELTPLGLQEKKENEYVEFVHKNSKHKNCDPWIMNQRLSKNKNANYISIYCELTGDIPPLTDLEKQQASQRNDSVTPRPSFSEIKNLDNWRKGYDEGNIHWKKGELYRKEGYLLTAIDLFDLARANGYDAPALYDSYAKAFRKLKLYEEEVKILDEAIIRYTTQNSVGTNTKSYEDRKQKVLQLIEKSKK